MSPGDTQGAGDFWHPHRWSFPVLPAPSTFPHARAAKKEELRWPQSMPGSSSGNLCWQNWCREQQLPHFAAQGR